MHDRRSNECEADYTGIHFSDHDLVEEERLELEETRRRRREESRQRQDEDQDS